MSIRPGRPVVADIVVHGPPGDCVARLIGESDTASAAFHSYAEMLDAAAASFRRLGDILDTFAPGEYEVLAEGSRLAVTGHVELLHALDEEGLAVIFDRDDAPGPDKEGDRIGR